MAKQKWITPVAVAEWPRLATPNTKFNPDGTWELQLRFTGEEAEQVKKVLDEMMEKSVQEAQELLQKKPTKLKNLNKVYPYDEQEDGSVIVKLRKKAVVRKKDGSTYNTTITIVDPLLKPLDPREVTAGSLVRADLTLETYYMPGNNSAMVLKRWYAVQLLKKNDTPMVGFDAVPEYATDFEEDEKIDAIGEGGFVDPDF